MVLTYYISSADKLSVGRSDSKSEKEVPKYYFLYDDPVGLAFLIKTHKLENPPVI